MVNCFTIILFSTDRSLALSSLFTGHNVFSRVRSSQLISTTWWAPMPGHDVPQKCWSRPTDRHSVNFLEAPLRNRNVRSRKFLVWLNRQRALVSSNLVPLARRPLVSLANTLRFESLGSLRKFIHVITYLYVLQCFTYRLVLYELFVMCYPQVRRLPLLSSVLLVDSDIWQIRVILSLPIFLCKNYCFITFFVLKYL